MLKRFRLVPPKIFYLQKKKKPTPLIIFRKSIKLARILYRCPQKLVVVKRVRITTPRKPNSARRKTIKGFYKFRKVVQAYVPGGHHNLKQFSQIKVHGNGARDLPGIYVNAIRGVKDLKGVLHKKKRRSLFGAPKIQNEED